MCVDGKPAGSETNKAKKLRLSQAQVKKETLVPGIQIILETFRHLNRTAYFCHRTLRNI